LEEIAFYHILAVISLVHVAIYAWFWSDGSHMYISYLCGLTKKIYSKQNNWCLRTRVFQLFVQKHGGSANPFWLWCSATVVFHKFVLSNDSIIQVHMCVG